MTGAETQIFEPGPTSKHAGSSHKTPRLANIFFPSFSSDCEPAGWIPALWNSSFHKGPRTCFPTAFTRWLGFVFLFFFPLLAWLRLCEEKWLGKFCLFEITFANGDVGCLFSRLLSNKIKGKLACICFSSQSTGLLEKSVVPRQTFFSSPKVMASVAF